MHDLVHWTISILVFLLSFAKLNAIGEIIWAVNCGGDAHVDSNGIRYQRDTLNVGINSDYGKSMVINRVHQDDQILYQTERYHTANFGYEIPIPHDGEYVLVLKFSEVWFTAPNQKVFDVMLNAEHIVVERLDIFGKVGRGTGHDEIISLKVKDGKLYVKGESSDLYYNKISVEFIKGDRDNPKVNAIYLMKGIIEDIPKLPPLSFQNQGDASQEESHNLNLDEIEEETSNVRSPPQDKTKRKRLTSGPKSPDPYSTGDTSSMFLPIAMAIGAFLPILFCLCKL